jgi:4a-hydroxytetrahydrobiopterin dehydratase
VCSDQLALRKRRMSAMAADTTATKPLAERKCAPCQGGVEPLTSEAAQPLLAELNDAWKIEDGVLVRQFKFRDFKEAMKFVNQVADIAEEEGHHPDIHISWNRVRMELVTHAIGGLSDNDFIVAAKTDKLPGG